MGLCQYHLQPQGVFAQLNVRVTAARVHATAQMGQDGAYALLKSVPLTLQNGQWAFEGLLCRSPECRCVWVFADDSPVGCGLLGQGAFDPQAAAQMLHAPGAVAAMPASATQPAAVSTFSPAPHSDPQRVPPADTAEQISQSPRQGDPTHAADAAADLGAECAAPPADTQPVDAPPDTPCADTPQATDAPPVNTPPADALHADIPPDTPDDTPTGTQDAAAQPVAPADLQTMDAQPDTHSDDDPPGAAPADAHITDDQADAADAHRQDEAPDTPPADAQPDTPAAAHPQPNAADPHGGEVYLQHPQEDALSFEEQARQLAELLFPRQAQGEDARQPDDTPPALDTDPLIPDMDTQTDTQAIERMIQNNAVDSPFPGDWEGARFGRIEPVEGMHYFLGYLPVTNSTRIYMQAVPEKCASFISQSQYTYKLCARDGRSYYIRYFV